MGSNVSIGDAMSIGTYKGILFYPQGDVVPYEGTSFPNKAMYPVGTWFYTANYFAEHRLSAWTQLVQYTMPLRIEWEMYSTDADELKDIPKEWLMIALVHP